MCWLNGPANPVRQVALAVLVFACVVAVGAVQASANGQLLPPNQPIPNNIRWIGQTPSGVKTNVGASATVGGVTTHHNLPVPVASSTLGRLGNAALRRGLPIVGWGLALRDLINGAGWAIDELQQQVTTQPTGTDAPPGSVVWCSIEVEGLCASSVAGTVAACNSRWGGCSIRSQDAYMVQLYRTPPPGLGDTAQFNRRTITQPTFDWSTGLPAQVVPDAVLGQALKNSPEVVNAILVDPETGAPIRTQELVDALNDLRRSLEAANGVETPGTDLVPSEDFAESTPNQTAWPGFCNWASVVCDFIQWFKLDPDSGEHPELPYEEREAEMVSYNSGLGGGSCPASSYVSVLDGEVEISWVGICGFVTYLRPLLIACAWILAAFIVVNANPKRL